MSGIGTLSEKSLHYSLKEYLGQPGDQFEELVQGYVADILRGDLVIEIQTRHLYSLKKKLRTLLSTHPVLLVHPIPQEKWIVRESSGRTHLGRRKSPRRGRTLDMFYEVVRIADLLVHTNFKFEVLLTRQEEVWRDDGQGSWRRKGWSLVDQRLLGVVESHRFYGVADYAALLPPDLDQPFSNQELAVALDCRPSLAQKVTYTLRAIGAITVVGKRGSAMLFET